MPPDKNPEARRWFQKVSQDLAAGTVVLHATLPLLEDALFHAQQAAEKAIKGYLAWHGAPFRKVHDLREIAGAAIGIDPSLEPLLKRSAVLTPFAGVFRYPAGDLGEPSQEDAAQALLLAREVYQAILDRLPQEVRPE